MNTAERWHIWVNFSSIKPQPKKNYFFKQNFKFWRLCSLIVPFWLSQVVMNITERMAKKELSYTGLNPWHFVLRLASGHIFSLTPQWFLQPWTHYFWSHHDTAPEVTCSSTQLHKRLHKKQFNAKIATKTVFSGNHRIHLTMEGLLTVNVETELKIKTAFSHLVFSNTCRSFTGTTENVCPAT